MKYNYIICHYDEIGIKGKNRRLFEQKLSHNILKSFKSNFPENIREIKILSGRLAVEISAVSKNKQKNIIAMLEKISGIAYFAFAFESSLDIEILEKDALSLALAKRSATFRVSAMRSDKNYPLSSQKINEKVGAHIALKTGRRVKLEKPGLNCFIEIVNKKCFIYSDRHLGLGGMPVGSAGKVAVLMSGGIDSPVAAYYLLKRGSNPVFVHFHSRPYTSHQSIDKVKSLVKTLKNFGASGKIYLVPFADAQKQILFACPDKLRIVLYRRTMMRIAEKIAQKEKCFALGTGESLGQVASQTAENMYAIEEAVKIPVYRPLIGFDKKEIISKAREIGTYGISILPHDDCCVRFMPKRPETKAKMSEVAEAEKSLDLDSIVAVALGEMEVITRKFQGHF